VGTKILVTGASGFLGWHFCRLFAEDYTIVGTHFRNQPEDLPAVEWQKINLLESAKIKTYIQEIQPAAVLHFAAISNAAFCEEHPALSHHINVYTTTTLAEVTKAVDIPMLFTSSDLVFNGQSPPYAEDDFTYPISQYGSQKQMAEDILLQEFEHTTVVRLPLLFGIPPHYTNNFFNQSIKKLGHAEDVHAFEDEFRTPLSASEAARWLQRITQYLLDQKLTERLLHIGSDTAVSRYQLLLQTAKIFGLPTETLIPTQQADLDLIPPRPQNVSLENSLAKSSTDFEPSTIEKQIVEQKELLMTKNK